MDCTNENWRPVVGFEGFYEVSSCGRVRSIDRVVERTDGTRERRRGRVLSLIRDAYGYAVVNLVANGYRERRKVHDLVLRSFIGRRPSDCYGANHINADRFDNRLENLEWCDHAHNMRHASKLGRIRCPKGPECYNAKLDAWHVRCIRLGASVGIGVREMADVLGVDYEIVRRVVRGVHYASVA